jgi:hypothetical protein
MESALDPGRFVSYKAAFEFVQDLEDVAAELRGVVSKEPAGGVSLYESFIAGCYEKAEEIDDSGGSFGGFVGELFGGWVKARQAAGADPGETAARLLAWMDDDPYGFASDLDGEAFAALDRPGRAAFVREVRTRFEAAAKAAPAPSTGAGWRTPDGERRRWGSTLRTLYAAQKDVGAYVALAEATGLTAKDCQAVAKMLAARRRPGEALGWVERGLALDKNAAQGPSLAGHELSALKRELLAKLGRGGDALDSAWAEYRAHPNRYSYEDLMKYVPRTERAAWRTKALDAACGGADLASVIELLLEHREVERLAELLQSTPDAALEGVTHYAAEPAAKRLEESRPELAARLWRAQGLRIVNAAESRSYAAALRAIRSARACYEKAGLAGEWQKLVDEVRSRHGRKSAFMAGFEAIATGADRRAEPSFLARARSRWLRR